MLILTVQIENFIPDEHEMQIVEKIQKNKISSCTIIFNFMPYIVHPNGITSAEGKIKALKEMNLWYVKEEYLINNKKMKDIMK